MIDEREPVSFAFTAEGTMKLMGLLNAGRNLAAAMRAALPLIEPGEDDIAAAHTKVAHASGVKALAEWDRLSG